MTLGDLFDTPVYRRYKRETSHYARRMIVRELLTDPHIAMAQNAKSVFTVDSIPDHLSFGLQMFIPDLCVYPSRFKIAGMGFIQREGRDTSFDLQLGKELIGVIYIEEDSICFKLHSHDKCFIVKKFKSAFTQFNYGKMRKKRILAKAARMSRRKYLELTRDLF